MQRKIRIQALAFVLGVLAGPWAGAQTAPEGAAVTPAGAHGREEVVNFPAEYFNRFRPSTALDMVEQLPGFRVDDGRDQRGYGGSVGNVLIGNRRPSSKQDSPSDILDRIPASLVDRIELIRGPVRDIELLGAPEVVNVLLHTDVPMTARWEVSATRNLEFDQVPLEASLSFSDQLDFLDYNAGLEFERSARGELGDEDIRDNAGLPLERRFDEGLDEGYGGAANLNASTWMGETLLHLNAELGLEEGEELETSRRLPQLAGEDPREEIFEEDRRERSYELGFNAERLLSPELLADVLFIYSREAETSTSAQLSLDAGGVRTGERRKQTEELTTESIARLELEWGGWTDHVIRSNFEVALNVLDNDENETEDEGAGPVPIEIPGANTRIEELRGDVLLKDTWSLGSLELDYGLGAETSTITQTGDFEQERSFFFFKPHAIASYSANPSLLTRLRVAREVSQLDFDDFVSATIFEDDDIILGNPNLRPETIWLTDLTQEWRFGRDSVFSVTLFHHWITDVEDLLPLTSTEEAPGNIGDGRRWGVQFESSIPMEWIGLPDARLDLSGRWQDSSVVDPVTGLNRVLSSEGDDDEETEELVFGSDNEYAVSMDFRQDFEDARVAWGWEAAFQAERPLFKVNELDIGDEGVELDAFVETTRWLGLKLRLEISNLLDSTETRDRIRYAGARALSPISSMQLEREVDGREIELSISGSF